MAALLCGLSAFVEACSSDDDGVGALPSPETKKGVPNEVMVAFAPGQLGDRGYADHVLLGVNNLARFAEMLFDSTNVQFDIRFVSPYNMDELKESLVAWAGTADNPFVDDSYQRRLLVLTEPYMVNMLDSMTKLLRPTDEVLVLKVNGDDVQQAAEKYGLGNRIHGLNISAARGVRRFCKLMRYMVETSANHDQYINYTSMPLYRLYDEGTMAYRDSIPETLAEEMGSETNLFIFSMSSLESSGVMSADGQTTIYQLAYQWAEAWQSAYTFFGSAFAIIDIGSGNAGWDYWLLGHNDGSDTFQTLVIDGDESPFGNRYYVNRHFGTALINWTYEWMDNPTATMPAIRYYDRVVDNSGENPVTMDYCTDNIPDYIVNYEHE
jgi:hypothetical protein